MGNIFDFFSSTNNKNNFGVTKEEIKQAQKMGFGYFFKLLRRSFGKLTGLNVVFIICNLPILLALFGLSGDLNATVNTPTNPLYAQLYGVMQYEQNPLTAALNGILGNSTDLQIVSDASRILMYSGLLIILTIGLSSAGMYYVLRNLAKSEFVTVWRDFFGAIKKNYKQALIIGLLDSLICYILAYDFITYQANIGDFLMNIFYIAIIVFALMYLIMRNYMYTIIVTFDLPLKKVLKNSFLLSVLGLKRNIVGLIGSVFILLLSVYLFILLPTAGALLPFVLTISLISFIGAYCAYPVIKKYMIDPYYDEHPEERPQEPNIEPIFKDRG
ncbi:MAG: hypothetical protein A2Y15_08315 [Clostridiales bacterium GWF2_36_10]|nr:MAG: hypothetical protein A2Y15_08315 [Clostridiales bacterium GWF2_36_10]HAN21052.1 hypothetical protein [Clostridiales bacterium]